jgi:LuxR family maltose regulon positive regulatory protein
MLEPLTDREREVLRYLPSHLNQQQIASALYVSLNTVKSHVKAIYRKTGAASRDDAVTIARSHGLLL